MQLVKGARAPGAEASSRTDVFTGKVYLEPIWGAKGIHAASVHFTPCARSYWHTHQDGQILIVTAGSGYICTKGEKPQKLEVGYVSCLSWVWSAYTHRQK